MGTGSSTAYITLEMVHLGFKSLYHQVGRGLVFIYLKGIWVLKISNNHNYAYFRMNLRVISGDVNF